MKILADLFMTFFKIGLFTFGGGYAMIPLLQAELVRKKKWSSDEELMDYYCIGQSTPGIIAINVATFIGYKRARSTGAVVATLGMVSPSLIIIMSLAHVLNLYMDNPYVAHAFAGIRINCRSRFQPLEKGGTAENGLGGFFAGFGCAAGF